jgi:hypothetical protein
MAGIQNHLHGERALVMSSVLFVDDDRVRLALELEGNPYSPHALGSSDIGIDPDIADGDAVRYVRSNNYSGIWVKEGNHLGPELVEAFGRTQRRHLWLMEFNAGFWDLTVPSRVPRLVRKALRWARVRLLGLQWGLRVRPYPSCEESPVPPSERRTYFVSYSSTFHAPLAQAINQAMHSKGGVNGWLDRAQREGPASEAKTWEWLGDAIARSHGFVLLLSRTALRSRWVRFEIRLAVARARRESRFKLVALKVDDVPIPKSILEHAQIIDCAGLNGEQGLYEELFTTLHGREGRRAWVCEQEKRSSDYEDPAARERGLRYSDLASESAATYRSRAPRRRPNAGCSL